MSILHIALRSFIFTVAHVEIQRLPLLRIQPDISREITALPSREWKLELLAADFWQHTQAAVYQQPMRTPRSEQVANMAPQPYSKYATGTQAPIFGGSSVPWQSWVALSPGLSSRECPSALQATGSTATPNDSGNPVGRVSRGVSAQTVV